MHFTVLDTIKNEAFLDMQLHGKTPIHLLGKSLAKPLSKLISLPYISNSWQILEAYIAYLHGKGAGEGFHLDAEIKAATGLIYRENPIIFDVGANIGEWSQKIRQIQKESKIFLFEPSTNCCQRINKLNLNNTVLIPKAISNSKGHAILYAASPKSPAASLHKRIDSYFTQNEQVEYQVDITTIDDIVTEYSIEFIDFLKMDIEGNELNALKGAANAIATKRIGALSFEFGSGNINSRTYFHDFWDLLTGNNFQLFRISPCGSLIDIDKYYEDLEYFRGVSNYVAVLQEHPYR